MSIESLKAQARRHEQQDEWQKALDQYGKAIDQLAEADQPDIGLYNRVGDLFVRVGNYERALEHYERAVELYREAYLPNNAIAVCKKIVRHVPARHQVYLTMGQIRAEQGFVPDARTNFLTYAELMQGEGNLDESFRALVEFADLVPEEVDVRITVADQMLANDRIEDGVAQLGIAYRILKEKGEDDRAFGLERRLMEADPDTDFDALLTREPEMPFIDPDAGFERGAAVADSTSDAEAVGADAGIGADEGAGDAAADEDALFDEDLLFDEDALADEDDLADEDAPVLADALFEEPPLEQETGEVALTDEGSAQDMPVEDDTTDGSDEEDSVALPFIEFGEDEAETGAAPDAETEQTLEAFDEELEPSTEEPEPAVEEPEPVLEEPQSTEPTTPSKPAPEPAPANEYVDLGSMIFGDEPASPKDTRFRVAYQEPSGDETADFQKMLTQFKEKVSENLDVGDVRAHHDLGTAYKEMGLLDEAISEFQAALRASPDHLPTYELMGQTFLEMGKHEAAVKSLERALKARANVEDELVGIYYYLARAYEHLGRDDSAMEFYDRVFSLDINFLDVTERLRALR